MFQRIVSLVPSLTETLADLGADASVVGITQFCVHPGHWRSTKTIIGGTKSIDVSRVMALRPDLILANKEENVKEQVDRLQGAANILLTDTATCKQALQVIEELGLLLGKAFVARQITEQIQKNFDALKTQLPVQKKPVAYFIWRKPYMVAGGDTFINSMLEEAGFSNIFSDRTRYPVITLDELTAHENLTIFLSSEPFPFTEKYSAEIKHAVPGAQIRLVDGEIFSWHGSRMLQAGAYFRTLHAV